MLFRPPTGRLANAFLEAKRAKGLKPKTLINYGSCLRIFALAYPRLPKRARELDRFLAGMGPTQETRETYYRLLRNFYGWCSRRRVIRANPMDLLEAPKLDRKVPRGLSRPQLSQLLSWPTHQPPTKAFLHLLADTGMRLGEAFSTRESSIGERLVHVRGKVGEREVPISPDIRQMVLEALPWPWQNANNASKAVRRAFAAAGINGKRASAQTLRHTFVRLWRGDESVLVGIMGWTTPKMLLRYRPYDIHRATDEHRQHSPLRNLRRDRQLPLL